jgi:DNA polymerase-3 subunit gamma/tau
VAQAEQLGPATLTRFAEIVHTGLIDMRGATAPRLLLELLCARMLLPGAVPTDAAADSAVLQRLERIERRVTVGQVGAEQVAAVPAGRSASPADAGAGGRAPAESPVVAAAGRGAPAQPAATDRTAAGPADARGPAPATESPVVAGTAPASEPPVAGRAAPRPAATDWPATPPAAGQGSAADWPAASPAEGRASADTATEPVAAAPAAAVSGAIDAAGLRRLWSDLLSAVRKNSRSTEAMLTNAMVQSVEGDTVVIAHPAAPLARRLAEPRNAEAIAKALGELLPGHWQVKCVHATQNAAATQSVAQKPRSEPPTFKRPTQPAESQPAPEPPRAAVPRPAPAAAPSADEPPPPEPPDDDYFEDAPQEPAVAAPSDPEADVVKLLTDKLGARAIDR